MSFHGYGDLHAPSYDRLFDGVDDNAHVAQLLHVLADGGEALEFGVGTGRFAVPLSMLGTRVHGVDNSQKMLDILAGKVDAQRVVPILDDIVTVRIPGTFSLVYCVFSTLFLLGAQERQIAALANAAAHLPLGGRLVIEMFVHDRERFRDNREVSALEVSDTGAVFRIGLLEPNDQVVHSQKIGLSGDGVEVLPNRLRFIYPAELDLMARLAGFERESRWADWMKSPFTATSGALVAVFVKTREPWPD